MGDVNVLMIESGHLKVIGGVALVDDATGEPVAGADVETIFLCRWFPLAAGALAKPGGRVAEIARAHGATTGQVALAWLLARSPVMLPIPGTGSIAHLEENVDADELVLDEPELQQLDEAA